MFIFIFFMLHFITSHLSWEMAFKTDHFNPTSGLWCLLRSNMPFWRSFTASEDPALMLMRLDTVFMLMFLSKHNMYGDWMLRNMMLKWAEHFFVSHVFQLIRLLQQSFLEKYPCIDKYWPSSYQCSVFLCKRCISAWYLHLLWRHISFH